MNKTTQLTKLTLLFGFLIGMISIILLFAFLLGLGHDDLFYFKILLLPTIIGGLIGLTIAHLLLKTRRQNEKLKANELQLRTLIDLSLDGIFLENERGEILDCNTVGHNMFGYSREEMLKLSIKDLVPNEFAHLLPDIIPDEMATGEVYLERVNKKKDGTLFPTEINTKFVEINGQRRLIAYVRDITEHKRQEELLRDVIQKKDKLFSIIGHDLRGAIQSILGFSDVIEQNTDELSKTDLQKYIGCIHEAAEQADNLLLNLMNWAYIQTNRIHFSPKLISLNLITEDVFAQVGIQTQSKNIKLKNNIPNNYKVFADEDMLKTILRNLMTNAIKYSYPEGSVHIKASASPEKTVISIRDEGTGMSPEVMKLIFELNKEKVRSGTKKEVGTGLGLIICKEFTEKHNGQIRVESEPGSGTTFFIELPNSPN